MQLPNEKDPPAQGRRVNSKAPPSSRGRASPAEQRRLGFPDTGALTCGLDGARHVHGDAIPVRVWTVCGLGGVRAAAWAHRHDAEHSRSSAEHQTLCCCPGGPHAAPVARHQQVCKTVRPCAPFSARRSGHAAAATLLLLLLLLVLGRCSLPAVALAPAEELLLLLPALAAPGLHGWWLGAQTLSTLARGASPRLACSSGPSLRSARALHCAPYARSSAHTSARAAAPSCVGR